MWSFVKSIPGLAAELLVELVRPVRKRVVKQLMILQGHLVIPEGGFMKSFYWGN
jgi:hypothetical protein